MFGLRRRNEGFEWQEYVRTTVLVRRRDRQKRRDDAMMAAVANIQNAKDRGVELGREGLEAVGDQAARAASKAGGAVGNAAANAGSALWNLAASGASAVRGHFRVERIEEPPSNTEIAGREAERHERELKVREIRAERERAVAAKYAPKSRSETQMQTHDRSSNAEAPRVIAIQWSHIGTAAAALAAIYFGGSALRGDLGSTGNVTTGSLATQVKIEPDELRGRASAVGGDRLRIGGRNVKLAGIEAPELNQPCLKANGRQWSCATSAKTALNRLVRGRVLTCVSAGSDPSGIGLVTCRAGDTDIGAELVRKGHVFALPGVFAPYSTAEIEARGESAGVWQGEVERPTDWRKRTWDEAKQTAPDGCPIKGTVKASSRTYTLPWTRGYDSAKPRTERGDRWFCSEAEAQDAGFVLAGGG